MKIKFSNNILPVFVFIVLTFVILYNVFEYFNIQEGVDNMSTPESTALPLQATTSSTLPVQATTSSTLPVQATTSATLPVQASTLVAVPAQAPTALASESITTTKTNSGYDLIPILEKSITEIQNLYNKKPVHVVRLKLDTAKQQLSNVKAAASNAFKAETDAAALKITDAMLQSEKKAFDQAQTKAKLAYSDATVYLSKLNDLYYNNKHKCVETQKDQATKYYNDVVVSNYNVAMNEKDYVNTINAANNATNYANAIKTLFNITSTMVTYVNKAKAALDSAGTALNAIVNLPYYKQVAAIETQYKAADKAYKDTDTQYKNSVNAATYNNCINASNNCVKQSVIVQNAYASAKKLHDAYLASITTTPLPTTTTTTTLPAITTTFEATGNPVSNYSAAIAATSNPVSNYSAAVDVISNPVSNYSAAVDVTSNPVSNYSANGTTFSAVK